jgi:hypothetical protein
MADANYRDIGIQWAPRVRQEKIRQLYELDAKGIYDEDLINDVGHSLYARCESFLDATVACEGKTRCPQCRTVVTHSKNRTDMLHCPECGWRTTWGAYFKTIQHKQLSGAEEVRELFRQYIRDFASAKTPRDKVLLIDRLIHGFHWYMKVTPTRAVAVNLIEGKLGEVIEFLNDLTYGPRSTPGTQETQAEWRRTCAIAGEIWRPEGHDRPRDRLRRRHEEQA